MSNLGLYQELVERASEAGGVEKFLDSVEGKGARKASFVIAASLVGVYGINKFFGPEIKKTSKKIKKASERKVQKVFTKNR